MPTIGVKSALLFEALGRSYTREEFDQLCFDFGIELDDVEQEEGHEVYKIDIPANRYDLLCLEGLSCALRVFLNLQEAPSFSAVPGSTVITVKPSTKSIRPFIVGAVLRGLKMNEAAYDSCLELQEQLHRNLCRRRTLVAIGTHDLAAVKGNITYDAREDATFTHLFGEGDQTAREMLEWFATDPAGKHLKEYAALIAPSPVLPFVSDEAGTILSMPPVINGKATKISTETRDMLIECTATDLTKAKVVLNTLVAMMACHAESIETVEVVYEEPVVPGGQTEPLERMQCPDLSTRKASARVKEANATIGINLAGEEMIKLCERMQLGPVELSDDTLTVTVPVTRSDIMHEVDIIEDIAIAYGFNNIERTIPVTHAAVRELPINLLADLLRHEVSRQGYMEVLTFGLLARRENFDFMRHPVPVDEAGKPDDDKHNAVVLSNPKTLEFQLVRTSLIPGLLKTLSENLSEKVSDGIRIFEVSDVVLRDPKTPAQKDVGTRNERRLAAMHAGLVSSFESLHGLVDRVMQVLSVVPSADYNPEAHASALTQQLIQSDGSIGEYKLEPCEDPMYFPGRGATVVWKANGSSEWVALGSLGVLHPDVLSGDCFGIPFPTTALELNIEPFVRE